MKSALVLPFLLATVVAHPSFTRTSCPDEQQFNPCICNNISFNGQQSYISVTCQKPTQNVSGSILLPKMKYLVLDQLVLADAVWNIGFGPGRPTKRLYSGPICYNRGPCYEGFDSTLLMPELSEFRVRELIIRNSIINKSFLSDPNYFSDQKNFLTRLTLSNCSFDGTLGKLGSFETTALGALNKLEYLELSWNNFTAIDSSFLLTFLRKTGRQSNFTDYIANNFTTSTTMKNSTRPWYAFTGTTYQPTTNRWFQKNTTPSLREIYLERNYTDYIADSTPIEVSTRPWYAFTRTTNRPATMRWVQKPTSPSLRKLHLERNSTHYIANDTFANATDRPTKDSIFSWNNFIAKYSSFLEPAWPALREIHLQRNSIAYIANNTFANLMALEVLDVSHNKLKEINSVMFPASLVLLNFGYNEIRSLDFEFLNNLDHLEELNLEFNYLHRISAELWISPPVHLRLVNLNGNFLYCDCTMKPEASTSINVLNVDGICRQPVFLSGISISQIPEVLKCGNPLYD